MIHELPQEKLQNSKFLGLGYGKTEPHNSVPPIKIDPFQKDPRLCPVYHLVRLEKSLVRLRPKSETCFWLSSRQPHKAVTPTTMCGWLKQVIVDTGSLSGKARDVRSVGVSTAVQARMEQFYQQGGSNHSRGQQFLGIIPSG